ncbi:MAG: hypothetical protein ACRDTN_09640, partial [Mycobacterium sp.]
VQGYAAVAPAGSVSYQRPGPQTSTKQKNTLGRIALIVSIVGFVFACIPGALIVGWVLLPIAFILGIVGLFLSGKTKSTSIAATIVSIVGAVVGVSVFFAVVTDAFSDVFKKSDFSAPSRTATNGAPNTDDDYNPAGSRENPLALGETVSSKAWEVTLGVPREAEADIAAENQFNDPPEAGMEYWIVPITATYTGNETGNAGFDITVTFVGSDNRTYNDRCGVIPGAVSDIGNLYKGGVAKGNTCGVIPAGADGLWALSTGFVGQPVFFAAR